MNARILPRIVVACLAALVLYGVYLVVMQWRSVRIADYDVRQNRLTGKVEVQNGGKWTRVEDDPYAESVLPEKLPYIAVSDINWGRDGLLCVRMTNRTTEPIRGRLALRLVQREIKRQIRIPIGGDRTLRLNVVLPPTTPVSFVMDTNLQTPDTTKIQTILTVQPISYSGQ